MSLQILCYEIWLPTSSLFIKKNYFFINSDHTQMHPVTMSMIAIIIHSFMVINIRCKCKHTSTPPSHSLECNKVFIICQEYSYKNDIKTLCIYPMKMGSILGLVLLPPTIPWWYQIFCEKSTNNNSNSKAISSSNSNSV